MTCPTSTSQAQPQFHWIATIRPDGSFSMKVGILIRMPPECMCRKDRNESTSAMELSFPLAQKSRSRLCHALRLPDTAQQPSSDIPNGSSSSSSPPYPEDPADGPLFRTIDLERLTGGSPSSARIVIIKREEVLDGLFSRRALS